MSAYDTAVLADSPDVYLKLDETSGTTAADSSGNGNDWTYSMDASAFTVPGIADSDTAAQITNPLKYVASPVTPSYLPAAGMAAYTIEVVADIVNYATVTDQAAGSVPAGPYFEITNAGVLHFITDAVTLIGPTLAIGTRYHLCATYDGATVEMFVDGLSVASDSQTGNDGVDPAQQWNVGYSDGSPT